MIRYLYGFPLECDTEVCQDKLLFQSQVFNLADKYDIEQLRSHIVDEFGETFKACSNERHFLKAAIHNIFKHDGISDKRLQSSALACSEDQMTTKGFAEDIESIPGFAVRLLQYVCKRRPRVGRMHAAKKCSDCRQAFLWHDNNYSTKCPHPRCKGTLSTAISTVNILEQ